MCSFHAVAARAGRGMLQVILWSSIAWLWACGNGSDSAVRAFTATPSRTVSPIPTATSTLRSPTFAPTPTLTQAATAAATLSATPTATFTATIKPSLTATVTPSLTATATEPPSPTTTATPKGSPRPTLSPSRTGLYVGVAKRNITPDSPVFLGGYGFGPGRRSTGVLAPIYVRAMVISNGERTVAFATNETQGTFAAYKRGPFGLTDVRLAVARATSGAIPATHVVVSSDHSHAGPDTTGVWGGLPNAYMNFLFEQTIGAIVDAWNRLEPAELRVGSTDATELLRSQFAEPPNDRVDGELRVLAVYDANGSERLRALLINFAAHATVMGASNRLISADWPGVVADLSEAEWGLDGAVVMVADVGRTQPADRGDLEDVERLQEYSGRVQAKVRAALENLVPVQGNEIDAKQFFLREPYGNPLVDGSFLAGIISRSASPPWLDGMIIGTVVSAARVGDLLFAALPGEGYPAIQFELQTRVPAQKHFVFGLANDQLGYLIAPEEGYEQVRAAAPGNDNAIFNVSPAIGDHVMCAALDAAAAVGFSLQEALGKCARWAGEDRSLPPGWE
ncbi:MAG: hypothetical protein KatS3mg077_1712 [Candidatus Binatia bacterium]|nr:MAG: hypothetical protein KatS3mg077_1712 [Candidatus Binatia bacterium]